MKHSYLLVFLLATVLCACESGQKSPFSRKMADYELVTIPAPDLRDITDNGKEVLNLYRFAADEIDAIYWEQYFGDKQQLIDCIEDPLQKEFALVNYGPWDRYDGKSFVEGYADRLPGAGFYPADMTLEEFNAWENEDKMSPYTMIRRAEDGSLQAVWYHDAFKEHIDKIANYLTAAADITIKPSVKKYLLSKAQALKSDDYYQSSLDWLEMDDSKMDLVIGPDESTDDQLLGIKRSYEAFVLLKNQGRTAQLEEFVSRIGEFQQALPCEPAYKTFQPGSASNIFSCDAIYYAGRANAGIKVIALNLPFDNDVQKDKGTRTILLENIIRAKFNSVVAPAGNVILSSGDQEHLRAEAFYWNIVFREVMHGLGVKQTVNGRGSVEQALGNLAPTFEELKANVAGVLLVSKLQRRYHIHQLFTSEDALASFFTSLVRSERFGEANSLGRANTIIYNFLKEKGAFLRQPAGQYVLDYEKMEDALNELTALVLKIQATGDYEFAKEFDQNYSKPCEDYKSDVLNLGLAKVPVDIRFEFKR